MEQTRIRLKDGSVIETEIHTLSPDEQSGFTSNGIPVVRFGEHWMERHILEKLTAWAKAYFSPRSPGPILPNFGHDRFEQLLNQVLTPSVEILQLRYQDEEKQWNAVLKVRRPRLGWFTNLGSDDGRKMKLV